MKERPLVLIVDDEANVRKVLAALIEQAGYGGVTASSGEEALRCVRAHDPDLVITDLKMPGTDGLELLRRLRADFPEIPVVMLTAHGTIESAVEAMKRGAYDFLTKPFDRDRVLDVIGRALAHGDRSRLEFQGPLAEGEPTGILGKSAAITAVRQMVQRVARAPTTVLITGETGTGKELVAEALHRLSARHADPLVRINCGAIPESLVEAELFGYERGAFTGAEKAKPGRFELADRGTLFLDEVAELPLASQVKLLRILQDGVLDRVGAAAPRKVDVRVVAATNRDPTLMAREGLFREDLLYRLRVIEMHVPPLRERPEDIPVLVDFFLLKHAHRLGRPAPRISPGALEALMGLPWPGNVRQLENAIERAVLLAQEPVLAESDFGLASEAPMQKGSGRARTPARQAAIEAERRVIRAALENVAGNVTRAAALLGLSRRGLQLKMKEFGLRQPSLSP
ncbi:MAG: sigma-54-dependent Fis family transcriptional regulator [Acidobacteria bacterium]|nr:sigma-54-dependent Fis family transcriptional regulator [Acidobacteriota bacterium]